MKRGMIFPFIDYVDRYCWLFVNLYCLIFDEELMLIRQHITTFRFQGQIELSYYNPSDFQVAIEEAFLADQGFTEKLITDINIAAGNTGYDETILKETNGSKQYAGCHFMSQVSL